MSKIFVRYGADGYEGALELLTASGVAEDLEPGMSVALKPNLVVASPSSNGATTSPLVVSGVVQFLKDCGVSDITIMEGSWVGDNTKRAWRVCGYDAVAKRYGVRLLDLKDDSTRSFNVDGFKFDVCESPLSSDYLINMPVLKGHCQTVMTCALKNLKGCLPDREKRRFHETGLHRPIALLNAALRPGLVLVDALCGDLSFEEGGNPIRMNRLILGRDPVMVDSYGASLMGISPGEVEHLVIAEKIGIGTSVFNDDDVTHIGRDESRVVMGHLPRIVLSLAAHIEERNACSACYASLIHALYRMDGKKIASLTGSGRIKIGQGWRGQSGPGIGVGDCASGFAKCAPGCPPRAGEITKLLKGGRVS
jgi:uncharacterized protein (DUF362 family)